MDKQKYTLAVVLLFLFIGCKSVSKYAIDEKHFIKIDTNLLGIWKAAEDTDKKNYIFIQNNYDAHYHLEDYKYDYYKINENDYYITYFNHHGKNPVYQQWEAFLSVVAKKKFLNIGALHSALEGYFFVNLIKLSHDTLTTAIIADTTLKNIIGCKAVRKHIEKNADNRFFYSDTLHFYKVSDYHLSLNGSVNKAN